MSCSLTDSVLGSLQGQWRGVACIPIPVAPRKDHAVITCSVPVDSLWNYPALWIWNNQLSSTLAYC